MQSQTITLTIPDILHPVDVLGVVDENLRCVQNSFSSIVVVRGNVISVTGDQTEVEVITTLFSRMIARAHNHRVELQEVQAMMLELQHASTSEYTASNSSAVFLTYKSKSIYPKTSGQKNYIEQINSNDIVFCTGPAGCGKTYLAVACALQALQNNKISRIILVRPVVEAGESLGFLPGTLEEKLDPYIRPLFDAIIEMIGPQKATSLMEQGIIEVAPLAFMRGRTFSDAYVILDEAQNTTRIQMKMFLTRMGFNSKFLITGDVTQCDSKDATGLFEANAILKNIENIAFVVLNDADIVRHNLVSRIVKAYEVFECKAKHSKDRA